MNQNKYIIINKFYCCGKTKATVIIDGRAVCVMPKFEYNRIVDTKQKNRKRKSART